MKLSRKIKFLAAIAALAAAAVTPANAQSAMVRVNVPFAFDAGGRQFDAGNYIILHDRMANRIAFQPRDAGEASYLAPHTPLHTPPAANANNRATLVFHKYGDAYFLRKVLNDNTERGYAWSATPAEKEAQRRTGRVEIALVHPW